MEVKLCFFLGGVFISRLCQIVDHVGSSNGKAVGDDELERICNEVYVVYTEMFLEVLFKTTKGLRIHDISPRNSN
jgi:hypothetical protein